MIKWIVGSGHIEKLPEQLPNKIYYANGGVFHQPRMPWHDISSCVITTAHVLTEARITESKEVKNVFNLLLENAPCELLWVRDTLSVKAKDVVANALAKRISEKRAMLSYDLIYTLFLNALGKPLFIKMLFSCFLRSPVRFLRHVFANILHGMSIKCSLCNLREMKISTGVLALLVALYESHEDDAFYLCGISAGNSPYAHNGEVAKRENHVEADFNVLRTLVFETSWVVIIEDQSLNALVHG